MSADTDQHWMARALELARQGWATTSPNPMVGAVVLDKTDHLVGEGFHQKAGGPHAEVVALAQAGEAARGGTLFVTLEPCCHWGRTGPCTEAVLASGINRVVVALLDPNPKVSGQGVAQLRAQGLTVSVGLLAPEAFTLNQHFFHAMTRQTPWFSAKLALTLDGKLATRTGDSQWITNEQARAWVHDQRAHYDAIVTTSATVGHDNPQLTVRSTQWQRHQPPARVVLDRWARLQPERFQCFDTAVAPTIWVMDQQAVLSPEQTQTVQTKGLLTVGLPWTHQGVDPFALKQALWDQGIRSVWVEAGGDLVGRWLAQDVLQQVHLVYAPIWLGDAQAPGLKNPDWPFRLQNAPTLIPVQQESLGNNWIVTLQLPSTQQWQQTQQRLLIKAQ